MNIFRILLIEDSRSDALLIKSMLAGEESFAHTLTHASHLADGLAHLAREKFDVVLTDLGLPDSQGLAVFEALHKSAHHLPIIILTGNSDIETAVAAIKMGAQEYLPKGEFSGFLLSRIIRYAIERNQLFRQLEEALAEVKTLSGLLPICATCKKIRDDKGYWNRIETYIEQHSGASFTHSICPQCSIKFLEDGGMKVSDALREAAKNQSKLWKQP